MEAACQDLIEVSAGHGLVKNEHHKKATSLAQAIRHANARKFAHSGRGFAKGGKGKRGGVGGVGGVGGAGEDFKCTAVYSKDPH